MRPLHKDPVTQRFLNDLDNLCAILVMRLIDIAQAGGTEADVVALFQAQPRNTQRRRELIGTAFMRLDDHPEWFGNGLFLQDWHSLLRRTRNSPYFGPRLFATWCEED